MRDEYGAMYSTLGQHHEKILNSQTQVSDARNLKALLTMFISELDTLIGIPPAAQPQLI